MRSLTSEGEGNSFVPFHFISFPVSTFSRLLPRVQFSVRLVHRIAGFCVAYLLIASSRLPSARANERLLTESRRYFRSHENLKIDNVG